MGKDVLYSRANNHNSSQNPRRARSSPNCKTCERCNTRTKSKSHPYISADTTRFLCDVNGCSTSFRRPSDLVRHKNSIHGTKSPCLYRGCGYASGREDKMNEHIRKIHRVHRRSESQTGANGTLTLHNPLDLGPTTCAPTNNIHNGSMGNIENTVEGVNALPDTNILGPSMDLWFDTDLSAVEGSVLDFAPSVLYTNGGYAIWDDFGFNWTTFPAHGISPGDRALDFESVYT